ncbi:hypothetical protein [Caproicibacter sp.]|uniref:hypothetical protein n=1 Tax=Caproicibacter sp. TaxID=2814884 RepID=UPI003988F5D9
MNSFGTALIASQKNAVIPEEQNLFGQFVGDWDFDWYDRIGAHAGRHAKGEWIFAWVLEGAAVQDLFICPSREERLVNSQPDNEYGTTIRIYNPQTCAWDIFYGCTGEATRLEARKEDDKIVLTETGDRKMKWIFSEITKDSFRWQCDDTEDGVTWKTYRELFAVRKKR